MIPPTSLSLSSPRFLGHYRFTTDNLSQSGIQKRDQYWVGDSGQPSTMIRPSDVTQLITRLMDMHRWLTVTISRPRSGIAEQYYDVQTGLNKEGSFYTFDRPLPRQPGGSGDIDIEAAEQGILKGIDGKITRWLTERQIPFQRVDDDSAIQEIPT
jgi:hypothetical protein